MARGSIRLHKRGAGRRYEAVVDLGPDPVSGKRRQRSRSFATRREAQAQLTLWLSDLTAAEKPAQQPLADYLAWWLQTEVSVHCRPSTVMAYTLHVRRINALLGSVPLATLTPYQVQGLVNTMRQRGDSGTHSASTFSVLRAALSAAVRLRLIPSNPARAVTPPRKKTRPLVVWTSAERDRFLELARTATHAPLWDLALGTGMRFGELTALCWSDLDWATGTLYVTKTVSMHLDGLGINPPKTRAGRRRVTLSPRLLAALRLHQERQEIQRQLAGERWRERDLICTTATGSYILPSIAFHAFRILVRRAGVPLIRVHDLRHTYISLLIADGAPLPAIAARVGHASPTMTMTVYAHALPAQDAELATRLD